MLRALHRVRVQLPVRHLQRFRCRKWLWGVGNTVGSPGHTVPQPRKPTQAWFIKYRICHRKGVVRCACNTFRVGSAIVVRACVNNSRIFLDSKIRDLGFPFRFKTLLETRDGLA
jgi:hypothetical protein